MRISGSLRASDQHRRRGTRYARLRTDRPRTQAQAASSRPTPRRPAATRSSSPRPSAHRRSRTSPSRSTRRPRKTSSAPTPRRSRTSAAMSPASTVQNLGPGQSQVSVRGVSAGQIVRDQPGVKEQVGVYLDESVISLSLFTPDLDLFDLNRVETLRGPQGTLFGSGSRRRHDPLHHQPAQARRDRGHGRSQHQHRRRRRHRRPPEGRDQRAARRHGRGLRAVAYDTKYGGFIDADRARPAARTSMTAAASAAGVSLLWQPTDEHQDHAARRLPEDPSRRLQPRGSLQPLSPTSSPRRPHGSRQAPAVPAAPREVQGQDPARRPDRELRFRRRRADLGHQLHQSRHSRVSRDARALTGSVSVDLGFPAAGVVLPSNLRDTTDLKTFTQELRLASTGSGPFQWVVGGFYSNIDRDYTQRLPTPGYDACHRPVARLRRDPATVPAVVRHSTPTRPTSNGFPPTRRTTPTCPTTSSRRRCSARRATTSASSS